MNNHPNNHIALEIKNLTVKYGDVLAVDQISLNVPGGVSLAIIGPNGAGKSTLLKAALGLVGSTGQVLVNGQDFKQNRLNIAYVPQRTTVDWDFPTTVFDVVLMGTYGKLGWFRKPGILQRQQAEKALHMLGISDLANRQIGQLSGGQQQRTFLARAIVQDAPIFILDEPLQGVDAVTEQSIIQLLHSLRDQGRTIICVHHDLASVVDYFDWVAIINKELVAIGPTREVFHFENLRKAYGERAANFFANELRAK